MENYDNKWKKNHFLAECFTKRFKLYPMQISFSYIYVEFS